MQSRQIKNFPNLAGVEPSYLKLTNNICICNSSIHRVHLIDLFGRKGLRLGQRVAEFQMKKYNGD